MIDHNQVGITNDVGIESSAAKQIPTILQNFAFFSQARYRVVILDVPKWELSSMSSFRSEMRH